MTSRSGTERRTEGPRSRTALGQLLERESDLAILEESLTRVKAGQGRRILIEGPAGIGKSALVETACGRAVELGMRVLAAEASEVGSQIAQGVAQQLLGVENWPDGDGGRRTFGPDEPLATSARLAQAVVELAGETPVLVSVDDLQWADAGSLRGLAELARHLVRAPIALVLAARTGDSGAALSTLLDDHRAVVLRPAPLSTWAAAELLGQRLGRPPGPELVATAQHETSGNPYLLRALGDALHQAGADGQSDDVARARELGSRAVTRAVTRRLERLDDDARALVEAAATVGPMGSPVELAPIAGLDPVRAVDAAQRLAATDLLRAGDSTELAQPLVGSAIRASLGAERRDQLLEAAARSLAEAGRTEEAAARLVELSPRDDGETAEVLGEAAGLAVKRGAPEVAVTLLRRALAEPPPPDRVPALRAALGQALLALTDPQAIVVLEEALAEAEQGPERAGTALALASALVLNLRISNAVDVLERTASSVRAEDPGLAEELEAQSLHYTNLDPSLRGRRLERLRARGDRRGSSELAYRMRLGELASESLGTCGPAIETATLAERALAGGALLSGAPNAHLSAVLLLAYAGRPELARSQVQDAISMARRHGQVALLSFALGVRGEVLWRQGDLVAAETDLRAALDLVAHRELATPFILRPLLETMLEQGETDGAEAEIRRAELTGELPDVISRCAILFGRGRTRAAAGALRLGLDDLRLAGESLPRFGADSPAAVPWRGAAASVLLELGEPLEAAALSGEEVELAEGIEAPEVLGPALRIHGRVTDERELLERAAEVLEPSAARLEYARALVDLGAALSEAGELAPARTMLYDGGGLAEDLGATALARRATSILTRAGGRPRRAATRGARSLTPAERRVSGLAAQGLTNRQIAETLVLATKTIESHLASAYRKLGIKRRAGLGDALAAIEDLAPSAEPG